MDWEGRGFDVLEGAGVRPCGALFRLRRTFAAQEAQEPFRRAHGAAFPVGAGVLGHAFGEEGLAFRVSHIVHKGKRVRLRLSRRGRRRDRHSGRACGNGIGLPGPGA